jgi:hypothetical protein
LFFSQLVCSVKGNKENELYVPLVKIANNVMDLCRDMGVDDVCDAQTGEQELIFQVNDPKCLSSNYMGLDGVPLPDATYRKPDVLATSLAAACAAAPAKKAAKGDVSDDCSRTWDDIRDNYATTQPANQHRWVTADLATELKLEGKMSPDIPERFEAKSSPKSLPEGSLPRPESKKAAEAAQRTSQAAQSSRARKSQTAAAGSRASQPTSISKRKRVGENGVVGSSSKKTKVDHQPDDETAVASSSDNTAVDDQPVAEDGTDSPDAIKAPKTRLLPGAVQVAIYAGCRLSSSPLIAHSLNLLIDGA